MSDEFYIFKHGIPARDASHFIPTGRHEGRQGLEKVSWKEIFCIIDEYSGVKGHKSKKLFFPREKFGVFFSLVFFCVEKKLCDGRAQRA